MAHYAKIGLNNEVIDMVAIDNIKCMTPGGIEREEIGCEYLKNITGHQVWIKCSYNTVCGEHLNGGTPFRGTYPSIGYFYNSEHDIFHLPRPTDVNGNPCNSWTLNTTTGHWECPLGDAPYNNNSTYVWNEETYQADNTQGWELETT